LREIEVEEEMEPGNVVLVLVVALEVGLALCEEEELLEVLELFDVLEFEFD